MSLARFGFLLSFLPLSTVMSSSSAPAQTDQAAAFAADPRVHFNKASNKWEYEDEQGKEFEWNEVANGWMPIVSSPRCSWRSG
jgi:HIV Tat-specific factor 1